MPDLTPQLRTRLSRMERLGGLFVMLALLMLLAGFGYYIYFIADRKGWFVEKVSYHTFVQNAAGLKPGDPVMLMGFPAGEITEIEAMAPFDYFNVYVQMSIRRPYYGYLWTDSKARITAADLLGNRYIELTKGVEGSATVEEEDGEVTGIWDPKEKRFRPLAEMPKGYGLDPIESPALTERLETLVNMAEEALPNILSLTNQLSAVLTNTAQLTHNADALLAGIRPVASNLTAFSARLNQPEQALLELLLPAESNEQLQQMLRTANSTLTNVQTTTIQAQHDLSLLTSNLNVSLLNVANLTSNLNAQVQANSLILSEVSRLILTTDQFVQGLQRHWLLKGAFGPETNAPVESILEPRRGGAR